MKRVGCAIVFAILALLIFDVANVSLLTAKTATPQPTFTAKPQPTAIPSSALISTPTPEPTTAPTSATSKPTENPTSGPTPIQALAQISIAEPTTGPVISVGWNSWVHRLGDFGGNYGYNGNSFGNTTSRL